MTLRYRVEGKYLWIDDIAVHFNFPIVQAIPFSKTVVIRLEAPVGSQFNENVFGVNPEGRIVWQVPPRRLVYSDSPFTGMEEKGGKILLSNWDGLELLVDPATGEVLKESFGK